MTTLKAIRLSRGLSQEELAVMIHRNRSEISRWERAEEHLPREVEAKILSYFGLGNTDPGDLQLPWAQVQEKWHPTTG
jgi:transcriptional regulator with XRE-family HTH domain